MARAGMFGIQTCLASKGNVEASVDNVEMGPLGVSVAMYLGKSMLVH